MPPLFTPTSLPTIDRLRATGAVPHYFGLGFIQLKLNARVRLHFWHPDLVATVGEEEFHDHRYDFQSTILVGRMIHDVGIYQVDPQGDHERLAVHCQPGQAEVPVAQDRGWLRSAGCYELPAGARYGFDQNQLHRIQADWCVSQVERGPVSKALATVVRRVGAVHVCPFAQTVPEANLWGYMADLLADH